MAAATPSLTINTKRANIAQGAMLTAGKKVAEKINVQTMQQSFPNLSPANAEFIAALTGETVKLLNHSFEHAWTTLSTMGTFHQFIPLANALDRIEADAEARLNNGDPPNAFSSSTDLSLTFPAQTVPMLAVELERHREVREQLSIANEEKAIKVTKRFRETEEKTRRIQETLMALQKSEKLLNTVDQNRMQAILSRLNEQ